ncbi:MAG: GPW/gp25 family protein [Acetivibrionales bacterium]|jgi:phage baseplate assembly protein W
MAETGGKGFLGKGWKFPVQVDRKTGRIMMSEHEEDIKESIRIIIMTYHGERVMRSSFGTKAKDYVFNTNELEYLTLMESDIEKALLKWEPRIRDLKVEVEADKGDSSRLLVNISYVVRSTNNAYNMVYPFYLFEGLKDVEDV